MKLILTASAADSDTLDVAPSVSASDELIKLILRPIFFSSDQNALFPISAKQSALRPFKMLRGGNQIDIAKPNATVSLTRSKHRSRLPEEDVTQSIKPYQKVNLPSDMFLSKLSNILLSRLFFFRKRDAPRSLSPLRPYPQRPS